MGGIVFQLLIKKSNSAFHLNTMKDANDKHNRSPY